VHRLQLLLLLLLQVALHNDGSSYQYEDLSIMEGSPVNSDLVFSANHSHLYVMTTDKVRDLFDDKFSKLLYFS